MDHPRVGETSTAAASSMLPCCPPTQRAIFAIGSSCGMTVAMALLSSKMLGPPQAASWTLVRTELRIGRQKEKAMRDLERTVSNIANKMARR
jgi:hypothetical protein